jgi:uncharacterized membrane protein
MKSISRRGTEKKNAMKTAPGQDTEKGRSQRFIELDLFRGCAILFMIILHLFWDLDYFGILPLNKNLYSLNLIVPIMFFLLVGICQAVNNNKYQQHPKKMYLRTIQRGLWVLNLGMLFTLLTTIVLPDRPIMFGVLHCIGCCIILSIPFIKFKAAGNAVLATSIIIAGIFIGTYFTVENPNILQLATGIHESNIGQHTIDYFPLLPWLGVCILGIALGNILYKDNKRRFPLPDLSKHKPTKLFAWLGQHSLTIYLLHQPIIAGLLFLYITL